MSLLLALQGAPPENPGPLPSALLDALPPFWAAARELGWTFWLPEEEGPLQSAMLDAPPALRGAPRELGWTFWLPQEDGPLPSAMLDALPAVRLGALSGSFGQGPLADDEVIVLLEGPIQSALLFDLPTLRAPAPDFGFVAAPAIPVVVELEPEPESPWRRLRYRLGRAEPRWRLLYGRPIIWRRKNR